jgi:hypothetical protein
MTELPVIGLFLILAGFVVAAAAALAVVAKAFKKNLFWGVACFLVPLATLVFTLRFWRDSKQWFFAQLAGTLLLLAGMWLMYGDPAIRSGLSKAMNHPSDIAAAVADEEPDGVPPPVQLSQILKILGASPIHGLEDPPRKSAPQKCASATPAAQKREPLIDARAPERKVRELYTATQEWYVKLQQKRPGPGASEQEVRTFNEESAQYNALLEQYKREAATATSR